jgi:1,4-dihydroxy-6-naphthoate synthase
VSLSLAISPCPNDTFAFHALVHGQVAGAPPIDVTYADVDVTNTASLDGRFDLVKVSYAALPWLLDRYALLPCGGALGRGCGPLLLVRDLATPYGDPSVVAGRRIAVPGDRTTAYLLMRLWSAGHAPASIDIVPFHEIMPGVAAGRFDAGLVIHEARFTYQRYALTAAVDLGEWWERDTGLPIPLGAILAHRERVDALAATGWVRASVKQAWADPSASQAYVLAHAQEMEPDVVARHIDLYVNGFTENLGTVGGVGGADRGSTEGYDAIRALLGRAADAGLVPALADGALDL